MQINIYAYVFANNYMSMGNRQRVFLVKINWYDKQWRLDQEWKARTKKEKKKTEEREKMAMIAKKLKPEGLSLC